MANEDSSMLLTFPSYQNNQMTTTITSSNQTATATNPTQD